MFDPSHPSDALCLTLHTLLMPYVWPFTPFWCLMFDPSHPSDALCLTLHTLLMPYVWPFTPFWCLMFDPSHPFLLCHLLIITVNTTSMDKNFDKNILLAGLSHGTVTHQQRLPGDTHKRNAAGMATAMEADFLCWTLLLQSHWLHCKTDGKSIHHEVLNVGHVHHWPIKGT